MKSTFETSRSFTPRGSHRASAELSPERLRLLLVSKAEQKLAAREAQLSLEFGE